MSVGYSVLGFAQQAEKQMREYAAGNAITNTNAALIANDKQEACVFLGYVLGMADMLGSLGARRFVVTAIQILDSIFCGTDNKHYIENLKEADILFRYYKSDDLSTVSYREELAQEKWHSLYVAHCDEMNKAK